MLIRNGFMSQIRSVVSGMIFLSCLLAPSAAEAAPIQWSSGPGSNGHWYEMVLAPQGITWDAAQLDALDRGGYLATILSAEENAFVFALATEEYWAVESGSGALLGPWLGGFQPDGSSEPGGGWTWVNGDGAFVYTNWAGGEPTNGVGSPHGLPESRLHFFAGGVRGATWNDYPATLSAPIAYVVEYDRLDAAPVPEPATLALMLTGLGAAAASRQRRRRSNLPPTG
jgi:hypothetical protein